MKQHPTRILSLALAMLLACASLFALSACAQGSEVPDGYQNATCKGAYFRLYVPTQWTVNTESGVSGAFIDLLAGTAVSMAEIPFDPEAYAASAETAAEDELPADALGRFVHAHLAEASRMTGFKLEKDLDANVQKHVARDITFTATVAGVQNRYRQVLIKAEDRYYIFTYSSVAETFDRWLDTVDGVIENILFYAKPYEGAAVEDGNTKVDHVPEGMKLVSSNDVVFRFFAPEAWIAVPGSAASQVYVSEEDRSNVSVISYYPGIDGYSVTDYWTETEKQYRDAFDDYTFVSKDESGKMGGVKANAFTYTYSIGGVSYRSRQVVSARSDMLIIMTYTAVEENFNAHLAEAEAMQNALTFRGKLG